MDKKKLFWYVISLTPLVLLILGYMFPIPLFSEQERLRQFIMQFGNWAPVIFILVNILQVILTPLSHYVIGIAGGFVFGTWEGFIYNWIGRVIGTAIAFYIARKYGRKLFARCTNQKVVKKYDHLFEKGKILLFLAYFLPLFPDDEISYLAGLSSIKSKTFLILMTLGHISGSLGLAYIGNGISSIRDPLFITISLVTLIGGIWFLIRYRNISYTKTTRLQLEVEDE